MPRIGEKTVDARQRKAVARNCLGGLSLALRMAQRGIDFANGGLGQRDDPAAIDDEIRGAPGAGVADRGGEDGRRRVACDAVRGQGTSLHCYGSFHENCRVSPQHRFQRRPFFGQAVSVLATSLPSHPVILTLPSKSAI
jgi:hypothetical protein